MTITTRLQHNLRQVPGLSAFTAGNDMRHIRTALRAALYPGPPNDVKLAQSKAAPIHGFPLRCLRLLGAFGDLLKFGTLQGLHTTLQGRLTLNIGTLHLQRCYHTTSSLTIYYEYPMIEGMKRERKQAYSFTLPPSLVKQLDKRAKQSAVTRSQFVVNVLTKWINYGSETAP